MLRAGGRMNRAREREQADRSQPETPGFGRLLRKYRLAAGLTQDALAEHASLSVRGIADLERGARRFPYAEPVERLAAALHLPTTEPATLQATARQAGSGTLGTPVK